MFNRQASSLEKLVALGFPRQWAKAFRAILGNPNATLVHKGPVTIRLPQGNRLPTNAALQPNMAGSGISAPINQPSVLAQSQRIAPALTLDGGDWHALQVTGGATTIGGTGVTINAPTTSNGYFFHNAPVTYASNIRMFGLDEAGGGIFKYQTPCFASTIARVQIGAESSASGSGSGSADMVKIYTVQRIDPTGALVGLPFTAYDPANFVGSQRSCDSGSATLGYIAYFSDRATGGAPADTAVKPNIGGWDIISAGSPGKNIQGISFTFVTQVCCVANQIVVCTRSVSICANGTLGAIDCGGGSCP